MLQENEETRSLMRKRGKIHLAQIICRFGLNARPSGTGFDIIWV